MDNLARDISFTKKDERTARLLKFREFSEKYHLSIIPIKGKKPYWDDWTQWCDKLHAFSDGDFEEGDNAGITCGPASGIIVVDIDNQKHFDESVAKNGWEILETLKVKTGGGGIHLYYKHPRDSQKYGNRSFKKYGMDIKADGGIIVSPGSIHPETGVQYVIIEDRPISAAPDWLLELSSDTKKRCERKDTIGIIDVSLLGLSDKNCQLIKKGCEKGLRSEPIMSVINDLVRAKHSDEIIFHIFEKYPIGEKYRDKGRSKEKWLEAQITKAREYCSSTEMPKWDCSEFTPEDVMQACNENERGDGNLFIGLMKERFCYDHSTQEWFEWNNSAWEKDAVNNSLAAVDKVVKLYVDLALIKRLSEKKATEASDYKTEKQAKKDRELLMKRIQNLQSVSRRKNVLKFAQSGENSLGILGTEWDKKPLLLACANCVIDLKTGDTGEGRPEDYIKMSSPVFWKGLDHEAPEWCKFLESTFNGDSDLILYMQRLFGYSISGSVKEQILPILWGDGRNGKSTILEVLAHILGPLAGPIRMEMLMDQGRLRSSAGATSDIMALRGKRLVWANEPNENGYLNISKAKWFVGSDTLTGRPPFGRCEIQFQPTHKMFLLTNHKPNVGGDDYAFWRRVHLAPFNLSFVDDPKESFERKREPNLVEALKKEDAGILAWLVKGCIEWQKSGLKPPTTVFKATEEYRSEQDVLGHFLEETCLKKDEASVKSSSLYKAYRDWCESNGHKAVSQKGFSQRMKRRFEQKEKSDGNYFMGIQLKEETGSSFY